MMTDLTAPTAEMPSLQRRFEGRALRSLMLTSVVWIVALLASVPLLSVLYMLITRGGARISLEVFTELPPTGFETGGGFGNAMALRDGRHRCCHRRAGRYSGGDFPGRAGTT